MSLYNKLIPYLRGFLIGMLIEYTIRVEFNPMAITILSLIITSVIIELSHKLKK